MPLKRLIMVSILSFFPNLCEASERDLKVTFITQPVNPGIGDSIIVRLPNGQNMMIDTGVPDAWGDNVVPVLQKLGIKHLEYLVVTHNHYDHYGSAARVIDSYSQSLEQIWHNGSNLQMDYLNEARKFKIELKTPKRGETLDIGAVKVEFLNPKPNYFAKDENDNSLVFRFKYGDFTMMFTGDIEYEAGDSMVQAYGSKLQTEVFKVGHHGSAKFSKKFVQMVHPDVAVCSCRTMPPPSSALQNVLRSLGAKWYSNRDLRNVTVEAGSDGLYVVNALGK